MKYLICTLGVAFLLFPALCDAATLRLTRGVDINGTVTYVNGNFNIHSRFSGQNEEMIIGREYVTEVRFNAIVDNPGRAEDWMRGLKHNPSSHGGQDVIVTTTDEELPEHVLELSSTELATDKAHHALSTLHRWVLKQN